MKQIYQSRVGQYVVFALISLVCISTLTRAQGNEIDAPTFTQEQLEARQQASADAGPAVILADIGIYDAKIVSKDNTTLTISFDIANNADTVQGDIKYGIDIIKASPNGQTIVDTLVSNEILTLKGHETQSKTLTYTVPAFLSSEYEVWLISRTTGGLMLGLSSVGTTTFTQATPAIELFPESCVVTVQGEAEPYTLYQGVDVAPEETLALSCTVMNPSEEPVTVAPTFETHRRTMYGELVTTPTSEETITLKGNEKKTVVFVIPKATTPQSYDVSVHLASPESKQQLSNKIVAHYVLRGGSATIQTVTLDKDAYVQGDTLTANIFWSPSADGFPDARGGAGTEIGTTTLLMQVTDKDGASCTQPVTQLLNPAQMEYTIQAPVIAPCIAPRATFTLTDATGNTLDTRTIESPVPEVVTPVTPEPIEVPFWNMLTVAMLLAVISSLIILFVVIQMLRHARSTNDVSNTILKALIFTVITGASMFGGVGEVGAISWGLGNLQATANISKSSYLPGETITINGSVTSLFCANGGSGMGYLKSELLGSEKYLINALFVGVTTKYGSVTYNAPIVPGTYTAHVWVCNANATYATVVANPYYYMGVCQPQNLTFTVTAPTPVNCVGSWSDNGMCSVSGACGQTGTVQQTYTITTPASGSGTACPYANGATQWGSTPCSTATCPLACSAGTGLLWTVGANTCIGITQANTNSGSSGMAIDSTAPTTGSATYLCTNGTWASSPNAGATCSVPSTINLISSNLSVPASGTTGSTLNFSATVSNIGNTTTGIGFSDNFSYSYTSNTGPWTNLPNIAKAALTNGGTSADNGSYTPASAGTLYIQHCVDSTNAIAESVEVPNCTVSGGIVVSAPALPPPPPSPCSNDTINNCDVVMVSSGGTRGTCTLGGECTYTCNNGAWVMNNNSCTIPQCSDGNDNDGDGFTDFGMGGDPDCSNASDNTESSVITPPDLTASPRTVQTGSSATISWDTNNGNETLCTLVGGTINSASTLGNGTGSAETGSVSFPVLARTTYTLTCPSGSDTLTVEIVPVGTET